MESLFLTDKTKELLPRIQSFVENELYPLETTEYLSGKFSKVESILKEKRALVKKMGMWGLQHHLTLCEFGQVSEVLAMSPFGHYVFNCQAPDIDRKSVV